MVRGLILFEMKLFRTAFLVALPFAVLSSAVAAQEAPLQLPVPLPLPVPQADPREPALELAPPAEGESDAAPNTPAEIEGEDIVPEALAPDYSKLSPNAERAARLDELFIKLAEKEDEEGANLVAEEILAIWSDSGSASVNLLTRRGTEAAAKGDAKLARTMYNHSVDLAPDYVEAWARSARLALSKKDYNRALNESLTTLALEPRHFYTLWTMGNVLEALGRQDEALEAYREANRLYPELKAVKDRLAELEVELGGTVL